jgi:phosphatidylglycerol:prolipoprotein diacylglycerol transferase
MILATKRKIAILATFSSVFLILAYFLSLAFSGRLILPQVFSLGPLTVHYYGIIIALAVLAAYCLARRRAPAYQVDVSKVDDLILWVIVGGFVGARLYHVLSDFSFYFHHPFNILAVWRGGLSIFGAIFGGIIALALCKKHFKLKPSILSHLDWLAPCVLLGQIIGRFGNLFNYEAFGYPANVPWRMFVPLNFRPAGFEASQYFQPLFLYEILGNVLILIILLKFSKNSRPGAPASTSQTLTDGAFTEKATAGRLFFMYILLYNVLRFFLELLRIDSTFVLGLRLNSVTSATLIILSLGFLFYTRHAKTT